MRQNKLFFRWFWALALFWALGAAVGLLWRGALRDCGLAGARTVEELYALEPTLQFSMGQAESEAFAKELRETPDSYLEQLEQSSVILLATAQPQARQYGMSLEQSVQIDRVLRGDAALAGIQCSVFRYYGFSARQDGTVAYSECSGLMQPGEQYLLFVEPSELDPFAKTPSFWLQWRDFGCVPAQERQTQPLPDAAVPLGQAGDSAYFCTSPVLAQALDEMGQRIRERYGAC